MEPSVCKKCFSFKPVRSSDGLFFSGFEYNESARKIIHTIKHERNFSVLKLLAPLLLDDQQGGFFLSQNKPTLVPVPLSPLRFKDRGFNQAEWLAYKLGKIWGLKIETRGLLKTVETLPQSTLSAKKRRQNLSLAFSWNPKIPPPQSVCLIDDILTTGETLKACREVLKQQGIKKVQGWTLFKVLS